MLKGKEGEFKALMRVAPFIKERITPFIDVPPPSVLYKKTLDEYLTSVIEKIANCWDGAPIFVDFFEFSLSTRTLSGVHPLKYFGSLPDFKKLNAIITTGLDRDDHYNKAVGELLQKTKGDLCIRLQDDDLDVLDNLFFELENLINLLNINRDQVHIIMDLRAIINEKTPSIITSITDFINTDDNINKWKTITISGSSFPENLSAVSPNGYAIVPRVEWDIWRFMFKNRENLKRLPSFGDYGVVYPNAPPNLDPRIITSSAKIRYTCDGNWLILKGHSLKKHPKYKQYHGLSAKLISREEYQGKDFSWGDEYIEKCATLDVGSGNLTTWVTVDTCHHLTSVAGQVAKIA